MVSQTLEDSSSNDYTSDSSSEAIQYHKVTLKKSYRNENKPNTDTQFTGSNVFNKTSTNGKDTKLYNMKFVNYDTNVSNNSNKQIPMTSSPSESMKNKKRNNLKNVKFYEIGDSISGYKFITDEPPLNKQNRKRKKNTFDIDPFQFDRFNGVKKPNCKPNSSIETMITEYWGGGNKNKKRGEDTYMPIIRNDFKTLIKLTELIDIEDITSARVLQFYEYSERIMNFTMQRMLKEDRIKWHPDKLLLNNGDKIVITRLFQIINDLWQSQGS